MVRWLKWAVRLLCEKRNRRSLVGPADVSLRESGEVQINGLGKVTRVGAYLCAVGKRQRSSEIHGTVRTCELRKWKLQGSLPYRCGSVLVRVQLISVANSRTCKFFQNPHYKNGRSEQLPF